MVKKWFKDVFYLLFHDHKYEKVGFKVVEGRYSRWSVRQYECQICKKTVWVDGRFDE